MKSLTYPPKNYTITGKALCFIAFLLVLCCTSLGQKLPNVQKNSLRAPSTLKIDGKPDEWNNFQAYNNATQVSYTLCNDDENLYLVIQTRESDVVNKIMGGGIALSIQKSGKKVIKML